MMMRGDVEKLSRGIGLPLICLLICLTKEEPRGVLVGQVNILMWILMVSGVFSSNALITVAPYYLQ